MYAQVNQDPYQFLNEEAVKKAVQLGLAIHAKISLTSTFDRKSYF